MKKAAEMTNGKRVLGWLAIMVLILVISACGAQNTGGAAQSGAGEKTNTDETELTAVKQMTNWYAQAEHGGQFAALFKGYYEEAGLDMTIEAAGPGISGTQIVAAGNANFGMGSTDEVLFARENGIPLVAIAGIFQKSPQAMMFHKGQDIKSFEDMNGRNVYVGAGAAYWQYIKKKYDLKINEFNYNGTMSSFIEDETAVSQSYVTSEPFVLLSEGIEVDYILNADSGYAPYGNLLYTTEKMIAEQPEVVRAYVEASIKGWNYYQEHYEEVNPFIQTYNPDMPLEKMKFSAESLQDLVYGFDAQTHGVGYMSQERWQEMHDILIDLELLKKEQDVTQAFTTQFLPQP